MKKTILTLLVCLVILGVGAGAIALLSAFRPKAKTEEREKNVPSVEVMTLVRENVPVTIHSQGMVESFVETRLSSEVGGQVLEVSPRFEVGEEFEAGEPFDESKDYELPGNLDGSRILMLIDASDYRAALAQVKATAADADLALEQEKARVAQAEKDWSRLGGRKEAPALVRRAPHMVSAEARSRAAQAAVLKAKHDVWRTSVTAPFRCRIKEIHIKKGAYVTIGMPIADIYSIDRYKVRIPLSVEEYSFIKFEDGGEGPEVVLTTRIRGRPVRWNARIVRSEGQVNRESRSLYLVAEVKPENLADQGDNWKDVDDLKAVLGDPSRYMVPGLFVRAEIEGIILKDVIKVPRKAMHGLDRVAVVGEDGHLRLRKVEIVRSEIDDVFVRSGLEAGERICLTLLSAVVDGMEVKVVPDKNEGESGNAEGESGQEDPEGEEGDGPAPVEAAGRFDSEKFGARMAVSSGGSASGPDRFCRGTFPGRSRSGREADPPDLTLPSSPCSARGSTCHGRSASGRQRTWSRPSVRSLDVLESGATIRAIAYWRIPEAGASMASASPRGARGRGGEGEMSQVLRSPKGSFIIAQGNALGVSRYNSSSL